MLTIFLPPFPFRGVEAPYLWVFYKFLHESKETLHFLISPSYLQTTQHFEENQRWEVEIASCKHLTYSFPSEATFAKHRFSHFNDDIFTQLMSLSGNNPILAFKRLLTERIPLLEKAIEGMLFPAGQEAPEAIVTCINCPSLEAVAKANGIRVVHVELGPLRAPNYRWTAYFDFTGVNGNTEAESRYLNIESEFDNCVIAIENLREFFVTCDYHFSPIATCSNIGVPLQVEDDSNLIAYSNGHDNNSLIAYAKFIEKKNLLIRAHPNSVFGLKNTDIKIDNSPNSIEFIEKCKEIVTINSSVGLEALLFERETTILGDSSFSFINKAKSDLEKTNRLAFYLLCYLTPFNMAFDPAYIRFRLKNPSEIEILKWNMGAYGYASEKQNSLAEIIHNGITLHMMEKIKQLRAQMTEELSQLNLEHKRILSEQQQALYDQQKKLEENQRAAEAHKKTIDNQNNLARNNALIVEQLERTIRDERAYLDTILSSSSWKITKPLRYSRRIITSLMRRIQAYARQTKRILSTIKSDPKILLRALRHINENGFKATLRRSTQNLEVNFATSRYDLKLSKQDTTYILTTKHCIFVAELIKRNLEKAGFPAGIIFEAPATGFESSLHFVICPQIFTTLPGTYIAFQMEQSVSSRWFDENYLRTLENAYAILDYSTINIQFLQDKGLSLKQINYTPISYIPEYGTTTQKQKEYDVLFYGDANNERRKEYLAAIQKKYKTKLIGNVFGEELYDEISKAKIIVNIHYYEGALLETTRIYECLSRDALIVSESSSDIANHKNLENIIDFTEIGDIDGMMSRIDYWLSSDTLREEKTASNRKTLLAAPNDFEYYFQRFLLATDHINFDTFYDLAGHNIEFQTDYICLGLPESTVRKKDFDKDNKVGFQYFPGLRHNVGWIGCGLSYKFILRKAHEQKFKDITICEDDVEFFSDWKERFDQIHEHLKTKGQNWDIFAGLIANLHADTNIKAIDKLDDFELIHIDKMVSMVLNTYNASVFPKVMKWNENFRDPYKNTIDRFIEDQTNIDVITTAPFLVGHKEELTSTLWGFKNSQYTDLIAASTKLLQEKVSAFKARNDKALTENRSNS